VSTHGCVGGVGCACGVGWAGVVGSAESVGSAGALPSLPPVLERPPLATFETHCPIPRLPGLGLVPAGGLGRAALHDATALVTTLPWFDGCPELDWGPEDELDDAALSWSVASVPLAETVPAPGCELTAIAVPPPTARLAAASAATVRRLTASGTPTNPTRRSRNLRCVGIER
jgi:hypothetical protein